jgi:hypothetical protein
MNSIDDPFDALYCGDTTKAVGQIKSSHNILHIKDSNRSGLFLVIGIAHCAGTCTYSGTTSFPRVHILAPHSELASGLISDAPLASH